MAASDPTQAFSESWLLDALNDGVMLVDAGWRITFANRAAELLLRVRRDDLVGRVVGRDLPEPPAERMTVYRHVMRSREARVLRDVVLESPELQGRIFEGEVHPSPGGGIAIVFRDVTERRNAERAATRLGRILEASGIEIYIFSADSNRFVLVSRGGQENLGYTMEELRAMSLPDVLSAHSAQRVAHAVEALRSGAQEQLILEAAYRRRDGSTYPVEVRLQLAAAERPPVFIALVLDVTERRRTQEQLEAQAVELEVLNEQLRDRTLELEEALATRNRFYAAMSHELRTPINAVLGYNDLILADIYGPLDARQREGIERSQKAARHLHEIVNDVLDISRLEAGKVVVQPEPVDFRALLRDLVITAEPLARRHGSSLRMQAETCETEIVTDPRHVRAILLNLISNAAKFGGRQPIDVWCGSRGGDGVTVEVVDRGEGIAEEDQRRIFEEFVQLHPGDVGEGTGLGLPISHRLAERLGGRLEVESSPGGGSTFRLVLPAAAPDAGT